MNQFTALFKKEILESLRQFKVIALVIVFMIFGIISPLTALLMPDILKMFMPDTGIQFELPEVQAVDAYSQFFSNVNQMGLVIMVIVFGSILTNEISRSTLINLVTKGLKRYVVISVKYIYACIIWTITYIFGAVLTYVYTIYYWENNVENTVFAFSLTWLYGIFLISMIMLASAVFKSSYVGVLLTILSAVILMMIISIHPVWSEYIPQYLLSSSLPVLSGALSPGDVLPAVIISISMSVLMFASAIMIFNKSTL